MEGLKKLNGKPCLIEVSNGAQFLSGQSNFSKLQIFTLFFTLQNKKPPRTHKFSPSYRDYFPKNTPPTCKFRMPDITEHVAPKGTENHRKYINQGRTKKGKIQKRPKAILITSVFLLRSRAVSFQPQHIFNILIAASREIDKNVAVLLSLRQTDAVGDRMRAFQCGNNAFRSRKFVKSIQWLHRPKRYRNRRDRRFSDNNA